MTPIVSKRHPIKFYFIVIYIAVFCSSLASIMLFSSIHAVKIKYITAIDIFIFAFTFVLYTLAIIIPYIYWKNVPKLRLDYQKIRLGKETFHLNQIKNIALTGKYKFKSIIPSQKEATAILFSNDKIKVLFDEMYSNSSEIKSFLEQVVVNKQEFKPFIINNPNAFETRIEMEETIKGNAFFSRRGLSIWGLVGIIFYFIIAYWQNIPISILLYLVAFAILWFTINSFFMHYFGLTKELLIVRNHHFIWKVNVYRLSDIREVVFEQRDRLPKSVRIITKDFKTKLYGAGTLRKKNWLSFQKKLKAIGVVVRNEI